MKYWLKYFSCQRCEILIKDYHNTHQQKKKGLKSSLDHDYWPFNPIQAIAIYKLLCLLLFTIQKPILFFEFTFYPIIIYLWRKVVCLFVLYVLFACHAKNSQYISTFWLALDIVGKPSLSKDAPSWFHNVSTLPMLEKLLNIE